MSESLRLLAVERFEGQFKRPFTLKPLPPLDQAVARAGDGRSYNRSFVMKEEPEMPPEGEVSAEEAELELEGEDELFADAELIED